MVTWGRAGHLKAAHRAQAFPSFDCSDFESPGQAAGEGEPGSDPEGPISS